MKSVYLVKCKKQGSKLSNEEKVEKNKKREEALSAKLFDFEVKKELKERIKNEMDSENKATKKSHIKPSY